MRRLLGPLLLGLLLLGSVILTGCDTDPLPAPAPTRQVMTSLHDPGANQTQTRSQPAGVHTWSGLADDIVYVQMTAPVSANAQVTAATNLGGDLPDEVVVFLDGAGQLGDLGRRVDSSGEFEEAVLPSTFDVIIAPDALLGRFPMRLVTPVTFNLGEAGEPLNWALPELELVEGTVKRRSGTTVAGAVITVYRSEEPRLPLGVTVVSDSQGFFGFEVPPGDYDLVVAGPSDGSVPIPTVRLRDQSLPLFEGVALLAVVPDVAVRTVRGQLTRGSGDPVAGRIRIEGIPVDIAAGGNPIPMGRYRVEFESESDGSWEMDLPVGKYSITAFPRYSEQPIGQTLSTGIKAFEVPFGPESVEDVTVVLPDATTVRIEAFNPGGSPMVGARVVLRMGSAPRYVWSQITGAEGAVRGAWIGGLIPDVYDIELIPPPDEDGNPRIARVQTRVEILQEQVVTLQARRSDRFQGLVFTAGEEPVGDVRIEFRDPDTGDLYDVSETRLGGDFKGLFEGVLPR